MKVISGYIIEMKMKSSNLKKNLLAILDKDLFMEKLSGENPKIKFINFEKNM